MNHRNVFEIAYIKEKIIRFPRQHNYLIREKYCNKLMEIIPYEAVRDKYSFYVNFVELAFPLEQTVLFLILIFPLNIFLICYIFTIDV